MSSPTARGRILILGVILAALVAFLALRGPAPGPEPGGASAASPAASGAPYSNIFPGDYVGPRACAECHEDKYKLWLTHPHSRMNQPVTTATVWGDFSGTRVEYAGRTYVFGRSGGDYTLEQRVGDKVERSFRMLLTVGSTFQQMYIGVQTAGPEPPEDALYRAPLKMPFGWWFQLGRWLPVGYFDAYYTAEYDDKGKFAHNTGQPKKYTPWQNNCAFCHNTYPYELALLAGGARSGFPHQDVKLTATLRDRASFERLRQGFLLRSDLVTTGISCESCHFGGREHATNQRDIHFLPSGPHLEFPKATPARIAGARKDPYVVNAICAQCHSATVPKFANGAAVINSREARDLEIGACTTRVRCTDCHDPHEPLPPPEKRDVPARFEELARRCISCHPGFADGAARDRHQGHAAAARLNCLDCHMPRISQGLDLVVHSHRISSPVEESMIAAGHPNACNICHLDKSLAWTLERLEKGWGKKRTATPGWAKWYGPLLDKPVGEVWATHSDSVVRLVAGDASSRERAPGRSLSGILRVLTDAHAVNRVFGLMALQHWLGRKVTLQEYDPMQPPGALARQVAALTRTLPRTPAPR